MYKPLLINVSVSLIVSGVQPHMTICSFRSVSKNFMGQAFVFLVTLKKEVFYPTFL